MRNRILNTTDLKETLEPNTKYQNFQYQSETGSEIYLLYPGLSGKSYVWRVFVWKVSTWLELSVDDRRENPKRKTETPIPTSVRGKWKWGQERGKGEERGESPKPPSSSSENSYDFSASALRARAKSGEKIILRPKREAFKAKTSKLSRWTFALLMAMLHHNDDQTNRTSALNQQVRWINIRNRPLNSQIRSRLSLRSGKIVCVIVTHWAVLTSRATRPFLLWGEQDDRIRRSFFCFQRHSRCKILKYILDILAGPSRRFQVRL